MFTPRVLDIKMSKMVQFFYFLLMAAKINHILGKIFNSVWEILFNSSRKFYGLLNSEVPLARRQHLNIKGFSTFWLIQQFFYVSTLNISRTVTPKPISLSIFWENSVRWFQVYWNSLHKLWLIFCCQQQKIQKKAIFDILMIIIMGVNEISREMTNDPIF